MGNAAPTNDQGGKWARMRLPRGVGIGSSRRTIPAFFLAFLSLVAQGTALVGRRVFHLAVDGAAFVIFG